jgi:large subunit ribosomal protein L11
VTSNLILRKVKQPKGSGEPNKTKIAKLTKKDLEEIAELKKDDMNTDDREAIMKSIAGTAKNMGIEVEK